MTEQFRRSPPDKIGHTDRMTERQMDRALEQYSPYTPRQEEYSPLLTKIKCMQRSYKQK